MSGVARNGIDVGLLCASIRRALAAGDADPWRTAVDLGLPLLCGDADGDAGGFEDALHVLIELGRDGRPVPVLEAAILNLVVPGLLPPEGRAAFAFGDAAGDLGTGHVAVASGKVSGTIRLVEGARQADWLVVFDPGGPLGIVARDGPGIGIVETPALAGGFCDVEFRAAPLVATHAPAGGADGLLALLRLALCARALGAARQGFEAVVAYAKVRRQFGQAIGDFQAIQHKLADSATRLQASELLLLDAARARDARSPHWEKLAALSVTYAGPALRKVALETQHCFGAIGFAEEHEAPALFRRIHADTVRCGVPAAARAVGANLLDGGHTALGALLAKPNDPAADFRARLRGWLTENWTDADRARLRVRPFEDRDWDLEFAGRMGRDGWTTLNWPASAGGMAATPSEQLAFIEEMQRAEAPDHAMICPCRILAPEIIAHGSEVLKADLLPELRAGRVTACLGYSEPEAGSDLASLRTTARRAGDHYIIDGQKIWTTDGHRATHMILAARTGADPASRHAGISLFVLPMDRPGITVRTMTGLHGHIFCNIFFDDVRLEEEWRLGAEGQGWAILGNALANERITMGGLVSRLLLLLGRIVDALRAIPVLRTDAAVQDRIGQLAANLAAGRELAFASIHQMERGLPPLVEAAAAKIHAGELAQAICEAALDMLGGRALLGTDAPDVLVDGLVEETLRLSIMYVVGGGSNEIQRSLIARRGLGLGR